MHTEYYLNKCLDLVPTDNRFDRVRVLIFTDRVQSISEELMREEGPFIVRCRPSKNHIEFDTSKYRFTVTNSVGERFLGRREELIIIEKDVNDLAMLPINGIITRLCAIRNKGQIIL